MKTQISSLVNGQRMVVRDADDAKYDALAKREILRGAAPAGSSLKARRETMEKVAEENGDSLSVDVRGFRKTLAAVRSGAGSLIEWRCSLSRGEWEAVTGLRSPYQFEADYGFAVGADGRCQTTVWTRRGPAATWKQRSWQWIGEEFVTILD